MTLREFENDIKSGLEEWEEIGNADIPVFPLYYYYPKSCDDIEDYQQWARNFIYDFKNGINSSEVANQVITVLKHFFLEETLSFLAFVCIPASTKKKNKERYEIFSQNVAKACDMWNGYKHIELDYDRDAKHNGGDEDFDNLSFDEKWFEGKNVIIFDDIITKGNSICDMKDKLEELGANVLGAITLGRTVHHDRGEDPYDEMDKDVKVKKQERKALYVSSSAEESSRLYHTLRSVSRVAKSRGLAESTVYGHLFSTGTINPHDYISTKDFNRAVKIYEGGVEQPSKELDKFLDVAGKAAFYHIRRNE